MKLWISHNGEVLKHPLDAEGPVVIGRDPLSDLTLQDTDISRRHCQIIRHANNRLELLDLESRNGTYVNGVHVKQAYLVPGDTVQVGDALIVITDQADDADVTLSPPGAVAGDAPGEAAAPSRPARPPLAAPDPGGETTEIDRSPLADQLQRRVQLTLHANQRIASEIGLQRLYNTILKEIMQFTSAERGLLMLATEDDGYRHTLAVGLKPEALDPEETKALSGFVAEARQSRDIVYLRRPKGGVAHLDSSRAAGVGACTGLCLPLVTPAHFEWSVQNQRRHSLSSLNVYGYVYLDNSLAEIELSANDRPLLKAMGTEAAIALQNALLYRQATTEPLTGLLNLGTFKRLFHEEMLKARRKGYPLTILLIDLDHFKELNDQHGVPNGNAVLREIGARIRSRVRREDLVGRYGGEEFIVCLPHTGLNEAHRVAEKVRDAVRRRPVTDLNLRVTSSLGVTVFPDHARTSDLLIKRADQALYEAKWKGRNQTVVWTEDLDRIGRQNDPLAGLLTGNLVRDQRNLRLMLNIFQQLNINRSTTSTLTQVADQILETIRADRVIIFRGRRPDSLEPLVCRVQDYSIVDEFQSYEEQTLIQALEERRSICSERLESISTIVMLDEEGRPTESFTSSILCIPLLAEKALVGALYMEFMSRNHSFTSADLSFFEALAGHLAAALYPFQRSERPSESQRTRLRETALEAEVEELKAELAKLREEQAS